MKQGFDPIDPLDDADEGDWVDSAPMVVPDERQAELLAIYDGMPGAVVERIERRYQKAMAVNLGALRDIRQDFSPWEGGSDQPIGRFKAWCAAKGISYGAITVALWRQDEAAQLRAEIERARSAEVAPEPTELITSVSTSLLTTSPHTEPAPMLDSWATEVERADETQQNETEPPEPEPPAPATLRARYRCIVIDPPWPVTKVVRDKRPRQAFDGDNGLDYPVMTLEQIAALPIADLADPDGCHLYLWTTHKYLPIALGLLVDWGFNYECSLTWVKPSGMTPYSWMYNTEHCLFARRGNLRVSRMGLKLGFLAPVIRHSAKPDLFYEMAQQASPEPRLDMFARRDRDGFTVWGNEVGNGNTQELARGQSVG